MSRRWDRIPGSNENSIEFSDDSDASESSEQNLKWDPSHPDNHAVRGEITFYADLTGRSYGDCLNMG